MAFSLSRLFGKKKPDAGLPDVPPTAEAERKRAKKKGKAKAAASSQQGMTLWSVVLVIVLLLIGWTVYLGNQQSAHYAAYNAATGELRMLTQRLGKTAALAIEGNDEVFVQLKGARDNFSKILQTLTLGGSLPGGDVPATSDDVRPALDKLSKRWERLEKDTSLLMSQEKNLTALSHNVKEINEQTPLLIEQIDALAHLKLQNGQGKDALAISAFAALAQRIANNAARLMAAELFNPGDLLNMSRDTDAFAEQLVGLSAANDQERQVLSALSAAFEKYSAAVRAILSDMQPLKEAKIAGVEIITESDDMLDEAETLFSGYRTEYEQNWPMTAAVILTLIALLCIVRLAVLYATDAKEKTLDAERQRQASEASNRQNQEAILRLMNELGDLADGDLTATATVTEDITGAIADSINYTIDELRMLVERINKAAGQVTDATELSRNTATGLLKAAEVQSEKIGEASTSVLQMADSMNDVSRQADESAEVARTSLAASEKGAQAVGESIAGMNSIREQIQETAKRIKRLGESSQEIGEIVELISDITEQTNVLALNAAIQAASAGEAGRGFTVVAEEVQRLAERSGEATKQISALVKTIQVDTQEAVSAMEESTQNVVEGAKRSDAAGQALSEISDVSRNLASLIEKISEATKEEAGSATSVADKMQEILKITEHTSEGTTRAAAVADELTALAADLKGSVAGFKIS
ncbi:MAG: methyl-accepting chemotaxis protein [Zoogloeaceae bacterium]|jgi:twitching motility protein PilJ|nr:methyl-accepting chemotaxis protein [Zoogloeaceae bacterium]